MSLTRVSVTAVRNLHPVTFSPSPRINILYGENGSGKTSVLEAIYLLGLARSFRSLRLQPVIPLIGRVLGDRVRTLGVHAEGGYHENFEYPLATTPCGDVIGKAFMLVPQDVVAREPHDDVLADFGAVG